MSIINNEVMTYLIPKVAKPRLQQITSTTIYLNELVDNYKNINTIAIFNAIQDIEDEELTIDKLKSFGFNDEMLSILGELTIDKNIEKEIGRTQYMADKCVKMTHYALLIKLAEFYNDMIDTKSINKTTNLFTSVFVILQRLIDEGVITNIELLLEDDEANLPQEELIVLEGVITTWNEIWDLLNEGVY